MNFRELDRQVLVADGAMRPGDMVDAAAKGVTLAVNNRPDGEEAGQSGADELGAAAQAAGLDYLHLPVDGPLSEEKVAALGAAMKSAQGRVLIFCASGTRSAYLWAMARAGEGMPLDVLDRNARRAGYDVTPLMPWLQRVAAARGNEDAPPS